MNQFASPNSITATSTEPTKTAPSSSCANIAKDTLLKGEISQCDCMEVHGIVEGIAHIKHVVIHPNGKIDGTLYASSAEIHGQFKGNISVTGLLKISSSGSVKGNVVYGQLAVEEGADVVADIRKVKKTA